MADPKYTESQLRQAAKQALVQGNKPLAQQIANRIKTGSVKEISNDLVSGLLGASQGATFGLGEEVGSVIRAGTEMFTDPAMYAVSEVFSPRSDTPEDLNFLQRAARGYEQRQAEFFPEFAEDKTVSEQIKSYVGDFGKRYKGALGSARSQLETARREDPGAYLTGELGAGLLQGGAGTTRAIAGAPRTIGAGMQAGGLQGIKQGALAGYGYGEGDPLAAIGTEQFLPEAGEALQETGEMAAIGGTLGSLFPALAAGGRNTLRFLTQTGTKTARVNEAGRRQIAESLMDDLEMRNITPEQAKAEIAATPGMTVADLGPNLQRLLEDIGQTGTRAGEVIRDNLKARTAGQYDRIVPAMSKALGLKGKPSMFKHHVDELLETARNTADPLYEAAYAKGVRLTPEMSRILTTTTTGQAGRKKATTFAKEALEDIGSPLKRKELKPGVILPTKHVDYMIRAMDNHVDALFRGKNRGLANEAKNRRNEFREAVYKGNEAFREARQAWAGPMASKNALESGRKIFREDAEDIAGALKGMGEGEKLYYRVGVMKAVEERLAKKMDYADIVNDLKSKRHSRDALRVAFGSEKNFDEFMDLLNREAQMQETASRVLGNSATARRFAQSGTDFGEKLAALAGYGVSLSAGGLVPPSIGGYLARKGFQAFDPQKGFGETYKKLVGGQQQKLLGTDIDEIMRPATLGGLLETGVPMSAGFPAGAAGTTGVLDPGTEYGR